MDKELIITIPHFNNPDGLINTISSINESFKIDIIITDDGSEFKLPENKIKSQYKNNVVQVGVLRRCRVAKKLR